MLPLLAFCCGFLALIASMMLLATLMFPFVVFVFHCCWCLCSCGISCCGWCTLSNVARALVVPPVTGVLVAAVSLLLLCHCCCWNSGCYCVPAVAGNPAVGVAFLMFLALLLLLTYLIVMVSLLMRVSLLCWHSCCCMTIFHYPTIPSTDGLVAILKDWKVRQICQFHRG
jgi:hypothetical protein